MERIVVNAIPDDGGFADDEHVAVIFKYAAEDDEELTETNLRLRTCSRPARAVRERP